MNWFEELFGFKESCDSVRKNIAVYDSGLNKIIYSNVNGKSYNSGNFSLRTLNELDFNLNFFGKNKGNNTFGIVESDVQDLIKDKTNEHATFQVASQFNCLEMISPNVTPEMGITRYEYDPTQGPACAIACGASTLYRNYFTIKDKSRQTKDNQINCLDDVEISYWKMQNGYMITNKKKLMEMKKYHDAESINFHIRNNMKVGIGIGQQVTLDNCDHLVNQIFCSAVPIAYNNKNIPLALWENLAKSILNIAYESVFAFAASNAKSKKLYLTRIGGGVFGNPSEWIDEAIDNAYKKYSGCGLDVKLVKYPSKY